jgi:hypothetical protein
LEEVEENEDDDQAPRIFSSTMVKDVSASKCGNPRAAALSPALSSILLVAFVIPALVSLSIL